MPAALKCERFFLITSRISSLILNNHDVWVWNFKVCKYVTELGFVGKCDTSLEIVSIMGNQLTSLHMCVPSVFLSIFKCCKKPKSLNIIVENVENSEEMWTSDSLLNLETFLFSLCLIIQQAAQTCFFLPYYASSNVKGVLEIFNACTRRDETNWRLQMCATASPKFGQVQIFSKFCWFRWKHGWWFL
jgi:hypothetical protein